VDKLDQKIEPGQIHFSSSRGGSIPGTHQVMFDSLVDTIEITHTARGREGFATGRSWLLSSSRAKPVFTISMI